MIAAAVKFIDHCCTCGHFPRFGYYVVGAQPQCRECYERAAARVLRRELATDIPRELVLAGTASVAGKSKYAPGH